MTTSRKIEKSVMGESLLSDSRDSILDSIKSSRFSIPGSLFSMKGSRFSILDSRRNRESSWESRLATDCQLTFEPYCNLIISYKHIKESYPVILDPILTSLLSLSLVWLFLNWSTSSFKAKYSLNMNQNNKIASLWLDKATDKKTIQRNGLVEMFIDVHNYTTKLRRIPCKVWAIFAKIIN